MRHAITAGALLLLSGTAMGQTAALVSTEAAAAERLQYDLRVAANRVPAGSPTNMYEAQFAALIDRSQLNCSQIRRAIERTTGLPKPAVAALKVLGGTLQTCGMGTGAVGGGVATVAGLPGFSVGGGSDYKL